MPRGEPAARPTGRRHRRDTVPRRATDGPGVKGGRVMRKQVNTNTLKREKESSREIFSSNDSS